jgi:hypothetical protein
VIDDASCKECAAKTHAIEGHCAGRMLKALRVHQRFPTRNPKGRATHLTVLEGKEPQEAAVRAVSVGQAPGIVMLPHFEPAGILTGKEPSPHIRLVALSQKIFCR